VCGRFTLTTPPETLADLFDVREIPDVAPRYNIAPRQLVLTVRLLRDESSRDGVLLRWGLVPFWARDPSIGDRLINARGESVSEKPSFRRAFRERRCLILADGFYEWQKTEGRKQPYLFRMRDGSPFAFAGLWESWRNAEGEETETCSIITTSSNDLVQEVHGRMPVIVKPDDYAFWLDPENRDEDGLRKVLEPYPADLMEAVRVSRRVNNPKNDDPQCLEPERGG
jgi:putative SOS response-associated peptidase YedK